MLYGLRKSSNYNIQYPVWKPNKDELFSLSFEVIDPIHTICRTLNSTTSVLPAYISYSRLLGEELYKN